MTLTDLIRRAALNVVLGLAACGGEAPAQDRPNLMEECVLEEDSRCDNSPFNNTYLWNVATCDANSIRQPKPASPETCTFYFINDMTEFAFPAPYSGTTIGSCQYVQNFSCDEVTKNPEKCAAYQCALAQNPQLYIGNCGKGIELDHLFLFSCEPFPEKEECLERTREEPWYKGCFTEVQP